MTETPPSFNPYVGPRTFREEEADRFFGREREARELVALVVSERLTLFYAQSGAGKSSLINTRLIPRLRDGEGFTVLPVGRVSGVLPDEVDPRAIDNIFVYHLIQGLSQKLAEKEVQPPASKEQGPPDLARTCLARFLSGETGPDTAPDAATDAAPAATAGAEGLVPHVLIIDQFEELLTTYPDRWQERTGFFEQLSTAMACHPNLWVVLTLREDYIAGLEPYSHLAPNRLRARFYMQRMGVEAAREAVERPVAEKRPFAGGVAGMLVDNLRMVRTAGRAEYHAGEYVEPVQLQVVCFQLWEDLCSREAATIELTDLERLAGGGNLAEYVDRALSDFYERAIARLLETPRIGLTEQTLRSWFSDKLITEAGTRNIVFRNETTGKTEGLPNRAVDLLAAQFLLRTELRAGGAWVELVHDRFIEPIREANGAWFARNLNPLSQAAQTWENSGEAPAKLYTGSQLAEAVSRLEAHEDEFGDLERNFVKAGQEAQRQAAIGRQRRIIWGTAALLVTFAALATWALLSRNQALAARTNAEAASTQAVANARVALAAGTTAAEALTTQEANLIYVMTAQAGAQQVQAAYVTEIARLSMQQAYLVRELTAVAAPRVTTVVKPDASRTPTPFVVKTPMLDIVIVAQQTQLAQVRATQTAIAESVGPLLFSDGRADPGRIYRLDGGKVSTIYTRPDGQIHGLARAADGSVYFCDANRNYLYRMQAGVEAVVYTHNTYVRDVAVDPRGAVYFSEATGAGGDGVIYRLDGANAVMFYQVRLADVDGSWAGTFSFDGSGDLWLSTGNSIPASLYHVVGGIPQRVYTASDGCIMGFAFAQDRGLVYADHGSTIYRLVLPELARRVVQIIPSAQWLGDVELAAP